MIKIKNVRTLSGEVITHSIPSDQWTEIEAEGRLLLLPGIIDPHICFGNINETLDAAIDSTVRGGITSVIDIPYEQSIFYTKPNLEERNQKVENLLEKLKIPLNYSQYMLYSDLQKNELDIHAFKKALIKGVIIHLGYHDTNIPEKGWENLFRLAAQEDIPIVLNSFDEPEKLALHYSLIEKAIQYTENWSNRLYVLNVSNQKEIDLIQEARERALLIFAETNPRYLYPKKPSEADCLWNALNEGIIETIGSGFNLAQESKDKILFKKTTYDFFDPLFLLPRLLTAIREKKFALDQLSHLTSFNVQDILELDKPHDFVLVDLKKEETIQMIRNDQTIEETLIGWPTHTILHGQIFEK